MYFCSTAEHYYNFSHKAKNGSLEISYIEIRMSRLSLHNNINQELLLVLLQSKCVEFRYNRVLSLNLSNSGGTVEPTLPDDLEFWQLLDSTLQKMLHKLLNNTLMMLHLKITRSSNVTWRSCNMKMRSHPNPTWYCKTVVLKSIIKTMINHD